MATPSLPKRTGAFRTFGFLLLVAGTLILAGTPVNAYGVQTKKLCADDTCAWAGPGGVGVCSGSTGFRIVPEVDPRGGVIVYYPNNGGGSDYVGYSSGC